MDFLALGGAIVGLFLVILAFAVDHKKKSRITLAIFGVVFVAVAFGMFAYPQYPALFGVPLAVAGNGGNTGGCSQGSVMQNGVCVPQNNIPPTYQSTATYSTVNHFSSAPVTGTAYYKAGNQKATTTAISNTDPNTQYQYWISNATYYVKPKTFNGSGTQTVINDLAYANGTVTINGYDLIADKPVTSGVNNASLSSGTAKIKFTVLGSATTTQMPFGGVLVIEANNTISQITCTGDRISATPGTQYQVTYAPSLTSNRYVTYEVSAGYDVSPDGLTGVTKTFECDFTASASPGTGSVYYAKLLPANYYYVNNGGTFDLDVEQSMNGLTTRTGEATSTGTFYWA